MKKLQIKKTNGDGMSFRQDVRKQAAMPENSGFPRGRTIFLSTGVPSQNRPVEKLRILPKPRQRREKIVSVRADYCKDAKNLSATALRAKYLSTYDSWRNVKQRCKNGDYTLAPEFEKFASFLSHVGKRPAKNYTLDRKDNAKRIYSPENCRWADKKEQANNRSTTKFLTVDGECQPLTVWAKRKDIPADTLRRRLQKGWTDEEVLNGKQNPKQEQERECYPEIWPGDLANRKRCEEDYKKRGRGFTRPGFIMAQIWPTMDQMAEYLKEQYIPEDDVYSEPMPANEPTVFEKIKKKYLRLKTLYDKCSRLHDEEIERNKYIPPKYF